ncbi:hypothetical protein [Spongiactinospora sp. TRM90649]|uniref:hypothetical protein n=1 Tax=Spongiactinospora sp. TRM90649 TaxID=3031114 RepID=UPI0023F8224A|nr:hypothetical protein [Spongiactinospora sp. TRM90649]
MTAGDWCNPFHPSGVAGSASDSPLRIWEAGIPDDLFVYLDDTSAQFELFKAMYADGGRLLVKGHVAYVAGPTGSGKSSFTHQCANHVLCNPPREPDDKGRQTATTVRIVDLSVSAILRKQPPVTLDAFCREIYDDIVTIIAVGETGLWLTDEEWASLQGATPREGFHRLSVILQRHVSAAVVLLPQRTPLHWIKEFLRMAWPRVLFLAEGDDVGRADFDSAVGSMQFRTTFYARVGALRDGDVTDFVSSRRDRTDLPHAFPDIPAPTLAYIIETMSYLREPVIKIFDKLFKILIDTAIEKNVRCIDSDFFNAVFHERIIPWPDLGRKLREDEA